MKLIKGIIVVIILLFMLIMGIAVPLAYIGTVVFLLGLFLSKQKKNGNILIKRPGIITAAGLILFFILGAAFVDTTETADTNHSKQVASTTEQQDASEKEAAEKAKKIEEEKSKAEAERLEKEKEEQKEKQATNLGLEMVTIKRVVDGDTFVTSDDRKIRLVGVNTPESTTKVEEYGKEASNYTTSKLEGKQVYLQKDVSDKDRYARYLRIVWLEIPTNDMDENEIRTKMFNADLVLNGYAEPSTYPPDVKYSDSFVKFAREAREQNTGLWAFGAEGTTKGDLDSKTTASSSNTAASSSNSTNSDTNSSTISNTNNSTAVPSNSGSESFKNCTELRKVYPDGVAADHPAYESKHDRDKDNWACER